MQLMAEDGEQTEAMQSLSTQTSSLLGNADVETNIYEGGLKSWECSIDLVQWLCIDENLVFNQSKKNESIDIVEVSRRT